MTTQDETLYVVTTIFNSRNFKSRYKLYNEFKEYIACTPNTVLITTEVAFADRPFEVTEKDNPLHVQLRSNDEMWHKERCVNISIQHLLQLFPDAKKFVSIDADVKFANPNWVSETLLALDHYDIVQPFSQAVNLGPKNEINGQITGGVMYNFVNKIFPEQPLGTFTSGLAAGHPGLCFGAKIESFSKIGGILDFCIHGSGDSHFFNSLMGDVRAYYNTRLPSEKFLEALDQYQHRCDIHIKKNIGYVPGIIYHFWHGKMYKRQYREKWDIICDHDYNPFLDIYPAANGLYQFAGNKKEFEFALRAANMARDEDSIDL